jgi:hypothetical protein
MATGEFRYWKQLLRGLEESLFNKWRQGLEAELSER